MLLDRSSIAQIKLNAISAGETIDVDAEVFPEVAEADTVEKLERIIEDAEDEYDRNTDPSFTGSPRSIINPFFVGPAGCGKT